MAWPSFRFLNAWHGETTDITANTIHRQMSFIMRECLFDEVFFSMKILKYIINKIKLNDI